MMRNRLVVVATASAASLTCNREAYARQLCRNHYRRLLRLGDPLEHLPIKDLPGTGYVSHGYFVVPVAPELRHLVNGDTSALEHRLVMAMTLDRPLFPDESVHHRNGDRLDNRPENLELWSRWQPRGQRIEDKLAWAREVLSRYACEDQTKGTTPSQDGTSGTANGI